MIPISYIPTPRPDTTSSTFYGSLPSLSTIMDSSRRRLWNELADGQRGMPNAASDFNSASHSSSSSLLSVGNSTTLDELEFLIPGEPILCKWPAQIIRHTGFLEATSTSTFQEKVYEIHFCDEIVMNLPRSFFLTAFERMFHTVKVGELHTTEVTFSQVLPKIQNVTPELDLILAGNSFFLPPYLTGRIPEVPAHGQYSEDVICSIIQHFEDRYIFNTVSFILVALGLALIKTEELAANINHRFIGLSRQSKIRYCPGGNGSDDSTGICGGRGGPESMCTDHCYFKESTLMMTIFEQSLVRPVSLPGDRSEGAMF
ncbi:hypothetical protein MJO28_015889 [Puccinia striiformis f. sp. tritici]|uniref:Uncharacterized protein n=1 Tax=Puccinia striiformis f. sp. tritici TaxID=168172 RepID=A0ACC0DRY9_9BASI|nr:hypothetical protein MJO28_015889 [Puccinia striiformis f. sp. tritici]